MLLPCILSLQARTHLTASKFPHPCSFIRAVDHGASPAGHHLLRVRLRPRRAERSAAPTPPHPRPRAPTHACLAIAAPADPTRPAVGLVPAAKNGAATLRPAFRPRPPVPSAARAPRRRADTAGGPPPRGRRPAGPRRRHSRRHPDDRRPAQLPGEPGQGLLVRRRRNRPARAEGPPGPTRLGSARADSGRRKSTRTVPTQTGVQFAQQHGSHSDRPVAPDPAEYPGRLGSSDSDIA